jgi:ABC-type spermidine/putrescine transport system, permease component I
VKKSLKYLLLVPGIVMLVVFLVMPLLSTIMPTVFDQGFSLKAYIDFFKDPYYVQIFMRTLRVSLIAAIVCIILGVPTSYFISRCHPKWRGLLMAISIFPMLTNSVIRAFAWINILGKNGVINTILMNLHIIDEPITMLYTEFSVLIGTIYLFLPLMIITLVGVMENIDNDMMEAAESLGANRLTAFFKVVLPLSLPGIIVGSVLVFTGALSAYTTPSLLGGTKNMVMATLINQKSTVLGDWTGASVIALIMIITTIVVMKVLNYIAAKLDKRGESNA